MSASRCDLLSRPGGQKVQQGPFHGLGRRLVHGSAVDGDRKAAEAAQPHRASPTVGCRAAPAGAGPAAGPGRLARTLAWSAPRAPFETAGPPSGGGATSLRPSRLVPAPGAQRLQQVPGSGQLGLVVRTTSPGPGRPGRPNRAPPAARPGSGPGGRSERPGRHHRPRRPTEPGRRRPWSRSTPAPSSAKIRPARSR